MSLNLTQENSKTVYAPLRDVYSSRPLWQGPPMLGHQLSPRKLYQGTLGYRWFTPRSRLHSDFNYTLTTCESKGAIHLVSGGAGLVIAVVSLVESLMSLELEMIYNPITIKKKVRDWLG